MFFVLCCNATKKTDLVNPEIIIEKPDKEGDLILFVLYNLTKAESNALPNAIITKKIISAGKLKRGFKSILNSPEPGSYSIYFLNGSMEPIGRYHIPDPLRENIEYVDDHGNMSRKMVYHTEKELVFRTTLPRIAKYLHLTYNDDEKKQTIISSLTIK